MIFYDIHNFHRYAIIQFFKFFANAYIFQDENQDTTILERGVSEASDASKRLLEFKKEFYNKIATIDDNDLKSFLIEIGKAMTVRAELNVFGAWQLEMDGILAIQKYIGEDRKKILLMDDLKQAIKQDDRATLENYIAEFEQLFKSKRMLQYLHALAPKKGNIAAKLSSLIDALHSSTSVKK